MVAGLRGQSALAVVVEIDKESALAENALPDLLSSLVAWYG